MGMMLGMALVIYLLGTCLIVPTWCAVGAVGGADVAISYATVAQLLTCRGNSEPHRDFSGEIPSVSDKNNLAKIHLKKYIYLVVIL